MSTMVIAGTRPVRTARPAEQVGQVRQVRPARPARQARPVRPTGAAQAAPVRLTRRGRVLATLVLTALVMMVLLAVGGASMATRQAGDPEPIRTIEVQRGQTLWSIASEVAEPGHIREMVYTIERLNSLPDATLTEGQLIAVPRG